MEFDNINPEENFLDKEVQKNGPLMVLEEEKNKKIQLQKSDQNNTQDMDQEQNVDVKPSQVNLQHLTVSLNNKIENYCGSIKGTTYSVADKQIVPDVKILVYFGSFCELPICQISSDTNGNFVIEDLPPGFYTIKAFLNDNYRDTVVNVKILPGESCNQNLYLREVYVDESNTRRRKFR
jgi:hypothetical protein